MTKEERKLYYTFLKNMAWTVNRQKVIQNYIVDFYIAEAKIVIELDGSQHFYEVAASADRERDKNLLAFGFTVLRYTNLEIQRNFEEVCNDIYNHFVHAISTSSTASGPPSPQGEGK